MSTERTQVAIVGGGPAGLMLSHLLARSGIQSVVIDNRTREQIEGTVRAGILEAGSVRMLTEHGVSDRVLREGDRHEGIELRFDGENHRIDFQGLVGASCWLYPQTSVFADLADRRAADGGDVRFGVSDTSVAELTSDRPRMSFTDAEGVQRTVEADILVGADGSRSVCRQAIPSGHRQEWFREYPFAWFGFLCEAPHSAPELIYAHSEHGFALISQRTETVQRMYFQCDPSEDATQWDDERIWAEMRRRVNGNGFELQEGPVVDKTVLAFRSFVGSPMRWGNLLLAGDAAHTVPPTGAKGLNLALADVAVLHEVLVDWFADRSTDLDHYTRRALDRVWRAQHFSYWMTTMLHDLGGEPFDRKRQLGELSMVTRSPHGAAYLAEAYTGWPNG